MKVWVTKYALTQGIEEKEVEISEIDKNIVKVKAGTGFVTSEFYFKEGKEWHKTKEEAIKKAEEVRLKKITSVEKQLEKLKNLKFE